MESGEFTEMEESKLSGVYENEHEGTEEATFSHWVEELFPPAHGFTLEELLADIGKEKEVEEVSPFDALAQGVMTPLDVGAIKNVYERVWMMQTMQKQVEAGFTPGSTLRKSFTLTRGSEEVEVCHAQTDTSDLLTNEEEACLWSSDEISVLRRVFQAARTKNKQLQAALMEVNERYEAMRAKHKKQQVSLDATTRKLNEAVKANERLHILSTSLNKQLKDAHTKIDFLRSQVETFKSDREGFELETHEARLALNNERLEREATKIKLERQTREALANQMLHEEKFKATHEAEVKKLWKRVADLEEELANEKKEHLRSKRGLEHLRTHFASLPYAEDVSKTNMVVEDQLKKWSI